MKTHDENYQNQQYVDIVFMYRQILITGVKRNVRNSKGNLFFGHWTATKERILVKLSRTGGNHRKTKTKVITTANQNVLNKMKVVANAPYRRPARENARDQGMVRFGFPSDWLSRWCEFLNQSQSVVK